ncbi:MAG: methyltransferase domain-containing protein [Paracoccaceae bacterium]
MAVTDWNPASYAAFRDLRLRPALDLLAQLPALPPGDVVDLGCGNGAAAQALRARWPAQRLIGVDASPAMLQEAQGYDFKDLADIAGWSPQTPPALIFSNAALHWLPDHGALLPRLAAMLASGGTLAVQMPRNFMAPSHRFLRDIAQSMFPDRFDFTGYLPPVSAPADYWQMLTPHGALAIWESEYLHPLDPVAVGHPVRAFTAATAMRPFAEALSSADMAALTAAYDTALDSAYPHLPDGGVLFPFRRLFLTLTRP